MALLIDHTKALRRPSELADLVAAVHAGDDGDEAEWLEWKTSLDLGAPAGRIHVARAVLGFANREPRGAARFCEGLGYFILGVEPGNLCGTTPVDPADLDNWLSPYLGGAVGPDWSPQWVRSGTEHVLVLIVEPPRAGDRIFPLRKEGPGGYQNGTVFVRRKGKTERADGADLDMLQERLKAAINPAPELTVTAIGSLPLRWFDRSTSGAQIDQWIEAEAHQMIEAARAAAATAPAAEEEPSDPDGPDSLLKIITLGNRTEPDPRTLEDYEAEVDQWSTDASEAATAVLAHQFFADDRNLVVFAVTNRSDLNLQDVEVKVHFEGDEISGLEEAPDGATMPKRPRTFGQPLRKFSALDSAALGLDRFQFDHLNLPRIDPPSWPKRTYIEDGSLHVTFHPGDLRPREQDESDEVHILLIAPSKPVVSGRWEATAKNWNGVMEGVIEIEVRSEGLTAAELLEGQ
jgi:hypothetical protein